jgi:hypothetical protein
MIPFRIPTQLYRWFPSEWGKKQKLREEKKNYVRFGKKIEKEWRKTERENEEQKKLREEEKKNPRNTNNEITKKIEIEEKRGERDALLWEMEIVRCMKSIGFF